MLATDDEDGVSLVTPQSPQSPQSPMSLVTSSLLTPALMRPSLLLALLTLLAGEDTINATNCNAKGMQSGCGRDKEGAAGRLVGKQASRRQQMKHVDNLDK